MTKIGWVLTPNGYRHRTLVHALKKDELLEGAGSHIRVRSRTGGCTVSLEERQSPGAMAWPPNGWSVFASWANDTGSPVNAFRTTWKVPGTPPTTGKQTIFLFSGIEDGGSVPFILQPVLQWGVSGDDASVEGEGAVGGPYWSVACWYSGPAGQASIHGSWAKVRAGETLTGVMTLLGKTPNGFSYSCGFEEYPETRLIITDKPELVWCHLSLEVYAVDDCTHLPTGSTSFSPIQLATGHGNITPNWAEVDALTSCGQSGRLRDNGTTVCSFSIDL